MRFRQAAGRVASGPRAPGACAAEAVGAAPAPRFALGPGAPGASGEQADCAAARR